MAEQQREAFEALEQIEAVAGWTTTEEIERLTAIVRAALSHAEGEAPEIEPGTPVMTPDGPAVVQKLHRDGNGYRDWWVRFVMGIERWYAEHNLQALVPASQAPAPQVAVPEPMEHYSSGGSNWNHDYKVGDKIVTEVADYARGWNDCRAAMLAAAPAAPAGELVTRCTAGLGCDEKGYCDAAATGQGDLCDRRTMAHEQPVSDPDGLPEPPFDAAHDARVFADRVEMKYGVRCQAGDIADCYEWQQLRQCLAAMAEYVDLATDERDIAALLERIVPRIDPQNPKPLDKSEHCCECTLYYERERIHDEIARLRKLGGNHD